jgi:hypothetical protein
MMRGSLYRWLVAMYSDLPSRRLLGMTIQRIMATASGSLSAREMNHLVSLDLGLSEEVRRLPRSGLTSRSEFDYRMAWARNSLKNAEIISKTSDNRWSLLKEEQRL